METTSIEINGLHYPIAGRSQAPEAPRALTRFWRASLGTDRGIVRRAAWDISGPIARSSSEELGPNGEPGLLGVDYADLETRFDHLLTSLGAVVTVDLSGDDPFSTGSSALGAFALGGAALGGGTTATIPGNVTHIIEDRDYLFYARGPFVTQVDPTTTPWTVIDTQLFAADVLGADVWFGKGYFGFGDTVPLQRIQDVAAAGATYAAVSATTYAKEVRAGNDRFFIVADDPAKAVDNQIRYTAVEPTADADFSNAFIVGDPKLGTTGLGLWGALLIVGQEGGIWGHTTAGRPVLLVDSLRAHRSPLNGKKHGAKFGWAYVTSDLSLYALKPGIADAAIGIGSDEFLGFEGFTGRWLALLPWRDEVIGAIYDGATTRLLHGKFNGGFTPATGRLDWYTLAVRNFRIDAIWATSLRTQPTLTWGEGSNAAYMEQGDVGARDIADPNYPRSVAGGDWYGQQMERARHMTITLRAGYFRTQQMEAGDSWQLAVSIDEAAYVNIGSAITADGYQRVLPVSGGAPLAGITGHTLKPRLRQVAGGANAATSPPEIAGFLDLEYVERPRTMEIVIVKVTGNPDEIQDLADLTSPDTSTGAGPVTMQLPDEPSQRYGYVDSVTDVRDLDDSGEQEATVQLQVWPIS